MPGPAPKPSAQRQRRNRTTTAATFDAAPAIRAELPDVREWEPATRRWWDTIWASPIAQEWVDADVPGLLALAVLVDEFWRTGDSRVHAEMRQASREFGLSPLSRRQLQWEVRRVEAAAKPAAPSAQRRTSSTRSLLSVLNGKAV